MNKNGKNILIIFFIGTLVFVFGSSFYNGFRYEGFNDFLEEFTIYQLYAFVLGYSNMAYFKYLEKVKWGEGTRAKRIATGIVGSTIITIIGLFLIRMVISVFYEGNSFLEYWANEKIEDFYFGIWAATTVTIIFYVIYFYNKYQKTKVKESQIVAKNSH